MKYKICKFVDGNNYEWYQVRCKWLIFSYWAFRTEFFGAAPPINITMKFPGFEEAKKYVEEEKKIIRSRWKKIVECVEA